MKVKILFISLFLLLAFSVSQLHLYVDDYLFLYNSPPLTSSFPSWLASYISEFGIYRPFALLYYYFIFSLYQVSPSLTHLLPWALQVFSGYLLYLVLKKQSLSLFFALALALIYTLHPFASESYMWLGANQGTLVSFIFILQLFLLQKNFSLKKTLFLLLPLSLISALTYESTLLFFIPILYLLNQKYPKKLSLLIPLSLVPLLVFFATKFAITPNNPRPLVNNLPSLLNNTQEMFKNLVNTHLAPYYQSNFWSSYSLQGYTYFLNNPALLIILLFFLAYTSYLLLSYLKKSDSKNEDSSLLFWFLVFLSSLPPLLANQTFYFGFRALFIPSISFLITLTLLLQKLLSQNSLLFLKILLMFSIPFLIFINTHIANQYEKLYQSDQKIAKQISQLATTPNSSLILTSEIPFDSKETFLHADHLLSCFFYEWSAPACLKAYTQNINHVAIKHSDQHSSFPSYLTQEEFFQQKPLINLLLKSDGTILLTGEKL